MPPFFAYLRERKGCKSMDIKLFVLIFFLFHHFLWAYLMYLQRFYRKHFCLILQAVKRVECKQFHCHYIFLKSIKIASSQHSLREGKKSRFFFSCSGVFSASLYIKFPVDNSLVNWSLAEMERQNGFLSLEVENFIS